jgi:hypothetical protein
VAAAALVRSAADAGAANARHDSHVH